jgi:hypothetical protein
VGQAQIDPFHSFSSVIVISCFHDAPAISNFAAPRPYGVQSYEKSSAKQKNLFFFYAELQCRDHYCTIIQKSVTQFCITEGSPIGIAGRSATPSGIEKVMSGATAG